jgi:hypothetical protein
LPEFLDEVDLNKNQLKGLTVEQLSTHPDPSVSRLYYNTVDKKFYGYDDNSWLDLANRGWRESVATYADLSTIDDKEDGLMVLVKDENALYRWDAISSIWKTPATNATGFSSGCRLTYATATTLQVSSGYIDVKGKTLSRNTYITLTWADVEAGTSKLANTWYFVYLKVNPSDITQFIGFISISAPTKDLNGNTIPSDSTQSKYHPTLDARFVGSFRTNASQNIVQFKISGNNVTYIGQGIDYILSGGNARVKTPVNVRSRVPVTSALMNLYYEMGNGNNDRYIGDDTNWTLKVFSACSGVFLMQVTSNSVYYMCTGTNVVSLGINGYVEDI